MKQLILESLQAHRDFVISRIESEKGKVYYQEMFETIQTYVQSLDNYYMPIFVLETAFSQLRKAPLSLNRELKYKKLALQHATDVIVCINKRFGK